MNEKKILFKNALIVPNTSEKPAAFWGWLLVAGNKIEVVKQGEPPSEIVADQVIDASDRAILPGIANSHTHSQSSLTRGSAEGIPLHEWLPVIDKEQKILTEEQAYVGALATYSELALNGATLISDMCLHPQAAIRAAREIGVRLVIAPYSASTKSFTPDLSVTEGLLASIPRDDEMVKAWVGLHDLETCGDGQLIQGAHLAAQYGTGLHLHCSESQFFVDLTLKRTGKRPVAHLASLGLLGEKTLLAHCVWVDEADRALMAEYGARVAHCPQSNLKLGSGIAPVPEMLEKNIRVTLGTDGARANNRLDMFDVMKFASLIHKGTHLDAFLLPPELIINMATQEGYHTFGIRAGSLSPEMLADLILVNLERFHLQPALPETIATNLVHSAMGADVDLVMVNGRILIENGELLTADRRKILAGLKKTGEELIIKRAL